MHGFIKLDKHRVPRCPENKYLSISVTKKNDSNKAFV